MTPRALLAAFLAAVPMAAAIVPAARAADCDGSLPQQEMNLCAHQDWQAADAELNAAYGEARMFLKGLDNDLPAEMRGAADALRDGQRAWITYRDKACEAEAAVFRGGSMEPFIYESCRAGLTRRRTGDLRALVEVR